MALIHSFILPELEQKWPTPHLQDVFSSWEKLQRLKSKKQVVIDGNSLDLAGVVALAKHKCQPEIDDEDETIAKGIEESLRTLKSYLANGYFLYGVNTGFGGSADTRTKDLAGLQRALMQHTQSGILTTIDTTGNESGVEHLRGHSMPTSWAKASMLVRCNANIRGHSAMSRPVMDNIIRLLCEDITPIIPLRGSISASGDLMPLSYVAGAIQGSPDVFVRKGSPDGPLKIVTADSALKEAGIHPIVLGPKEGLSLINGTATSAAVAALALHEAQQLAVLSQFLTALTSDALAANVEWAHPFIHQVRPHCGQIEAAQNMRVFLKKSKLSYGLEATKNRFSAGLAQERYALRSSPQWIGPQLEDLAVAAKQLNVELNSTSDNPVVNVPGSDIHCGANFQAAIVTSSTEKTRSCLQMLGKMLFSQTSEMINHDLSNGLPSNLAADDPSLSFCLKGIDVNMAAYQSELAFLANPVSSHVQSAEMHNQAINSLALLSSRYTMEAVEVLSLMSAACLYTGCQGVDLRVLHRTFLKNFEKSFAEIMQDALKGSLVDLAFPTVLGAMWTTLHKAWYDTASLDAHERCRDAASASLAVLHSSLTDGCEGLSVSAIRKVQERVEAQMLQEYTRHRDGFFQKPMTAEYLGQGPGCLYVFVRDTLGVPMHRGLEEHPVASEEHMIDGRSKKTIGSWVSRIYEAIRGGQLHDELMRCLDGTGVVEREIDGSRVVARTPSDFDSGDSAASGSSKTTDVEWVQGGTPMN